MSDQAERVPWTPQLVRVMAGLSVLLQTFLRSARDPFHARDQLAAGLHADFVVMIVLSALVLAVGVGLLLARRSVQEPSPVAVS